MVFQPEYGHLLNMHAVAAEELPYYRFVQITTEGFKLATGSGRVVGITVPSVQDYVVLKDSTTRERKGYLVGEKPQILYTGVCHLEITDKVELGDYVTNGAEGKGQKLDDETAMSKIKAMALDKIAGNKPCRVVLHL